MFDTKLCKGIHRPFYNSLGAIVTATLVAVVSTAPHARETAEAASDTATQSNAINSVLNPVDTAAMQSSTPPAKELLWKRAIDRDDIKSLRSLLDKVDVKLTNDKGKTALMAAVKAGQHNLVKKLLEHGLGLNDRSLTGGTSLMYAALGKQNSMISYLLDANRESSHYQSFVDAQSTNGWTAVMIAAAKGFDGVVKQLVLEGNADVWRADAYQWTPLMRAIDNRHQSVIDYMLGLDQPVLDAVNENGATALHVAVEKGDAYTVSLLIERGINTDIRDNVGRTALDIAVDRNDSPIAELLK